VSEYIKKNYLIKDWYTTKLKKWQMLEKWATYAEKWKSKLKVKEEWKILEVHDDFVVLWTQGVFTRSLTGLTPRKTKDWEKVYKWEVLTNWALDIMEYKNIVWDLQAQRYIISETKKVYMSQWQDLNDKHIEVVVKQLFSKVFVQDSWETSFIPGTRVKYEHFVKVNNELVAQWRRPAKWIRLALWLTNIAKETDSRLSAASFQETIRVMVWASLRGAIDDLSDLKANVIIWRLLPVWEIYRNKHWY
jgi:hypothetical protein